VAADHHIDGAFLCGGNSGAVFRAEALSVNPQSLVGLPKNLVAAALIGLRKKNQ
jgi:hypothetical protein